MSTENVSNEEKGNGVLADVSGSAIVPNEQVALYFQFDDDEPIKGVKYNGKEFTMKMLPVENGFVEFTDGKKKFRMFVKHCY